MIGFLVKKNFFDTWDNLFKIAFTNLGFIVSLTIPVFAPVLFEHIPVLSLGVMFAGVLWCSIYLSAVSFSVKAISDYGNFGFRDIIGNLKKALQAGLIFGILVFLVIILFSFVIPFYLGINSLLGLLLAAIVFWTLIISILAFQFFFAVISRLDSKPGIAIKKCFILFFDNPAFCLFSMIHCLIALLLSIFVGFLVPGPAGVLLFLDEGLRLRLMKYDWLDANPDSNKRKIPWDTILTEEREKTGSRSLKNFIFPWKD